MFWWPIAAYKPMHWLGPSHTGAESLLKSQKNSSATYTVSVHNRRYLTRLILWTLLSIPKSSRRCSSRSSSSKSPSISDILNLSTTFSLTDSYNKELNLSAMQRSFNTGICWTTMYRVRWCSLFGSTKTIILRLELMTFIIRPKLWVKLLSNKIL